jgi:hypothetical protein
MGPQGSEAVKKLAMTACAAAVLAAGTLANADVVLNFGNPNLSGGQVVSQTPALTGTLLAMVVSFDFEPNATAQANGSYASDAALSVASPITVPVQWGGYDMLVGGPTTFVQNVWSFDGPDSAFPGAYTDIRTDIPVGLFGTGGWTILFGNCWSDSTAVQYNSVTVTLYGVQAVPGPAAAGVLGMASLGMMRRRRR